MRRSISLLLVLMFFVSGCASSSGSSPSQPPTKQPSSTLRSTATLVPTETSNLPASSIPGIRLPTGFQISVYARGLNTPRFMTIGPNGALLVANRGSNSVVAFLPGDLDRGKPGLSRKKINQEKQMLRNSGRKRNCLNSGSKYQIQSAGVWLDICASLKLSPSDLAPRAD